MQTKTGETPDFGNLLKNAQLRYALSYYIAQKWSIVNEIISRHSCTAHRYPGLSANRTGEERQIPVPFFHRLHVLRIQDFQGNHFVFKIIVLHVPEGDGRRSEAFSVGRSGNRNCAPSQSDCRYRQSPGNGRGRFSAAPRSSRSAPEEFCRWWEDTKCPHIPRPSISTTGISISGTSS